MGAGAVSHGRTPGDDRAFSLGQRSRAGVAGLAVALYLGAGLLATSPAVFETDRFLGYGAPVEGRVTPGDHLQTAYSLWLPGHQLARGAAPWLDPYSFQPVVEPRVNFAGWPFAAVFGPLEAAFGTVAGWNLFVVLTFIQFRLLRSRMRSRVGAMMPARHASSGCF